MGVLIASCTENSNLEYKTPKRCVSPLRQRLAVVKWYRVDAEDRKSFVNEAEVKTSKRLKMAEAIMVYIGLDALSLIHD